MDGETFYLDYFLDEYQNQLTVEPGNQETTGHTRAHIYIMNNPQIYLKKLFLLEILPRHVNKPKTTWFSVSNWGVGGGIVNPTFLHDTITAYKCMHQSIDFKHITA